MIYAYTSYRIDRKHPFLLGDLAYRVGKEGYLMSLICPLCTQQYDQRLQCPRCQVNLVVAADRESLRRDDPLPAHWSRNPWGRTVLGVVLAQGLFYVLHSLLLAGALAIASENVAQQSLFGLLSTQALQVVGLFAGSLLAGAGQRNGGLYGSMVGVWNGILCTTVQGLQGEPITAVSLYGQPILHTALGAFAGVIGSWIWQPLPSAVPKPPRPAAKAPLHRPFLQLTRVQIHWVRVFAGLAIAVGCYIWADTILHLVLKTGEGHISIRASVQQTVLTLEIWALGVFVGGAFAGAATWNGTAQGAWLGILGAALYLGYQLGYQHAVNPVQLALFTGGILALGLLGGSFGGRLLPPVMVTPPTQRGRFGTLPA